MRAVATTITVIDSGSRDRTVEIARAAGAEVIAHPFTTHAAQVNAAVRHLAGRGGWLFRLDADEVLLGGEGLSVLLSRQPDEVAGVAVRRQMHFLGGRIRRGGMEPSWQLRLFRAGRGRSEERWMDEHVVVDGDVVRSPSRSRDISLKPLTAWITKHNNYASREAIDTLIERTGRRQRARAHCSRPRSDIQAPTPA